MSGNGPLTEVQSAAQAAWAAGLSIVPPAEDGTKAPMGPWAQFQKVRATPAVVSQWYGPRTGLGLVCGAVSGNLECLEFDDRDTYERLVELAYQSDFGDVIRRLEAGYVEDTPSGGVHWLYRCETIGGNLKLATRPKRPDEQRDPHDRTKTLIETRGEGGFVIVAPSNGRVHPSGGAYRLRAGGFSTIPTLTPGERHDLFQLAHAFHEHPPGDDTRPPPPTAGLKPASSDRGGRPGDDFNLRATWADVLAPAGWTMVYTQQETTYWRRPGKQFGISATTNRGGSDYLIVFSTSTPFETRQGYSKFRAYAILHQDGDFNAAARDVRRKGYGTSTPADVMEYETPAANRIILDPADPLPSAKVFVDRTHTINDRVSLQHQGGVFYAYDAQVNAYHEHDETTVRADLYKMLEVCLRRTNSKAGQPPALAPFQPTKAKVENVVDALRAVTNLPSGSAPPCWLRDDPGLDPRDILACRNGLLHVPTRHMIPATPDFFTLQGLDFAFDPNAPAPEAWLHFLRDLWPDEADSPATLQEAFGYNLTPRTHLQKILMLVGPKRSGKGTIARIMRLLLGERNCCGPTLAGLGEQFGLASLVGKGLAIISDARIGGRTDTAILTERLLSISGEDALSVPRKFLPDWTGRLSARFWLLTNVLPKIEDGSGALASRFIVLRLAKSFYGREDHGLLDKLIPDLPGILNWALAGYDRLYARGRFLQPASATDLVQEFEDLGSPIGAFVRERCEVGRGFAVRKDLLFDVWKQWCSETGRDKPGTTQVFARNLRSAVPWLGESRPLVMGSRVRYFEGVRPREDAE